MRARADAWARAKASVSSTGSSPDAARRRSSARSRPRARWRSRRGRCALERVTLLGVEEAARFVRVEQGARAKRAREQEAAHPHPDREAMSWLGSSGSA
jgi:hypothetical protein